MVARCLPSPAIQVAHAEAVHSNDGCVYVCVYVCEVCYRVIDCNVQIINGWHDASHVLSNICVNGFPPASCMRGCHCCHDISLSVSSPCLVWHFSGHPWYKSNKRCAMPALTFSGGSSLLLESGTMSGCVRCAGTYENNQC
jgi:hypothetical protein